MDERILDEDKRFYPSCSSKGACTRTWMNDRDLMGPNSAEQCWLKIWSKKTVKFDFLLMWQYNGSGWSSD